MDISKSLCAFALSLCCAGSVQALTMSVSASDPAPSSTGADLLVSQFDRSLGNLTGVSISVMGTVTSGLTVTDTPIVTCEFRGPATVANPTAPLAEQFLRRTRDCTFSTSSPPLDYFATLTVSTPSAQVQSVTGVGRFRGGRTGGCGLVRLRGEVIEPYDPNNVPPPAPFDPLPAACVSAATALAPLDPNPISLDPSAFADFVGTGDVLISFDTEYTRSGTSPPPMNDLSSISAFVTYSYSIPVPASFGFLAFGIAALGLCRRKPR